MFIRFSFINLLAFIFVRFVLQQLRQDLSIFRFSLLVLTVFFSFRFIDNIIMIYIFTSNCSLLELIPIIFLLSATNLSIILIRKKTWSSEKCDDDKSKNSFYIGTCIYISTHISKRGVSRTSQQLKVSSCTFKKLETPSLKDSRDCVRNMYFWKF